MSDVVHAERRKSEKRSLDAFVVVLCLAGAAVSFYLFYMNMFATFSSLSSEPAGFVIIRENTVQRRLSDRLIWDRLYEDSYVYDGDLIRISRLSKATLDISENQIELGENTLVRIQKDPSGSGPLRIELFSGEINVAAGGGETVLLSIGDRVVQASPGTVLNVLSGDSGTVLRITEGEARIIDNGQISRAAAGSVIVQDEYGNEVRRPMAAVISPQPNAQYLKTVQQPLVVEFVWARINMQPEDYLRLEIAEDNRFTRNVTNIENLNSGAMAVMNPGFWHWRLFLGNEILTTGRLSVRESLPSVPLSPTGVDNTQDLQFRWTEVTDALGYELQVSNTPDFQHLEISRQVQTNAIAVSDMENGTWYWRVMPVYSSSFEGAAQFSQTASFRVGQEVRSPPPVVNETQTAASSAFDELEESLFEQLFAVRQPQAQSAQTPAAQLSATQTPTAQTTTPQTARPAATSVTSTVTPEAAPTPAAAETPPPPPIASPTVVTPQPAALSLLPAPLNMHPERGHQINAAEILQRRSIFFSWAQVQEANSYILTIYRDAYPRRQQIFQTEIRNETGYFFNNFNLLDNGTFIWQIEAITYDDNDRIIRRGRPGESDFTLDIPRPGRVQTVEMGPVYGME